MAKNPAQRGGLIKNGTETEIRQSPEPKTGNSEDLVTTKEIARSLKVTERTIQNLVARGIVPTIRIGRCVRFRKSDVLVALEK